MQLRLRLRDDGRRFLLRLFKLAQSARLRILLGVQLGGDALERGDTVFCASTSSACAWRIEPAYTTLRVSSSKEADPKINMSIEPAEGERYSLRAGVAQRLAT